MATDDAVTEDVQGGRDVAPRRRQAPPEEAGSGVGRFLALVAAFTGLQVLWGLARGALSLQGLLLGPTLLAAIAWLLLASGQALRAGRWTEGAAPLVALGLVVGVLGSGRLARPMIFPGDPTALPAPGPAGPGAEVVAYTSDDGVALRGLLVRGRGEGPRATVVYFHGNAESAARNRDVAEGLAARGLDVFVAEYRGYGGCPGAPSEAGLLRDARAAVAAACERTGAAPGDVVLFGRSLGTGVASALAAEGTGRAVVLLSPYTSILDLAADLVPRPLALLAVRDTFDSRARLLRATQPVTVLHGTRDQVIPFAHGEALAAALGPRARLVPLTGYDHNDVFARASLIHDEAVAAARGPR
ncbi:MAG: alpha/beta hydrolase [Planctomycetes bacterium]|nr:alpha/beta hydrolase [Planctomycetota bacterium]